MALITSITAEWRQKIFRHSANAGGVPGRALTSYHPLARNRLCRFVSVAGLMLFCFIYGFFFSVLVPSFFAFLVFPLLIVALLVIWALPDLNWAPTRALEWLFFATLISLVVWPNYLAIAVPGLPWITLLRSTSFPLVLILLICISTSRDFRSELTRSLKHLPAIPTLLAAFVAIQFVSIGLSKDISTSIQKFIVAQTSWTAMFFAGAFIFLHPGRIGRWAMVLWTTGVLVSLISIWEFQIGHLPWVGHIPTFLKINDEAVQAILSTKMRAGTTRYRTQATFSTPLGLAEYIAIVLPFVLHFATARFTWKIRLAAILSVPLLLYGSYLTDAKLGTVGALIGILLYVFGAALQSWRRNKHSLIAASILFSYPAAFCAAISGILFIHRFKILIFGDGSHANSTAARAEQYALGLQKFLAWPFGYGIGMGGETLGFGRDIAGFMTIDTYYLSVVLEYGIAGFIVYYGMFAIAIYEAGRRGFSNSSKNPDRGFLLPITVSLVAFIVIKSVFSQQDNHPIVFMMLGATTALSAARRDFPRHNLFAKLPRK
jgi:hypothetical protein